MIDSFMYILRHIRLSLHAQFVKTGKRAFQIKGWGTDVPTNVVILRYFLMLILVDIIKFRLHNKLE
jgi:hypothetical protein